MFLFQKHWWCIISVNKNCYFLLIFSSTVEPKCEILGKSYDWLVVVSVYFGHMSDQGHTHSLSRLRLQWPVMLSIWLSIATASQWPRDHSNANARTHTHTYSYCFLAQTHSSAIFSHSQSWYKHIYQHKYSTNPTFSPTGALHTDCMRSKTHSQKAWSTLISCFVTQKR